MARPETRVKGSEIRFETDLIIEHSVSYLRQDARPDPTSPFYSGIQVYVLFEKVYSPQIEELDFHKSLVDSGIDLNLFATGRAYRFNQNKSTQPLSTDPQAERIANSRAQELQHMFDQFDPYSPTLVFVDTMPEDLAKKYRKLADTHPGAEYIKATEGYAIFFPELKLSIWSKLRRRFASFLSIRK